MKEKKLKMGSIGGDGCPCGEFKCKECKIVAHCWRTGRCCEFSGVHWKATKGNEEIAENHAKEIAEYIKEAYRTDVKITNSPRT